MWPHVPMANTVKPVIISVQIVLKDVVFVTKALSTTVLLATSIPTIPTTTNCLEQTVVLSTVQLATSKIPASFAQLVTSLV